jgi:tRNA 2-thiouridine synthesizing protein E
METLTYKGKIYLVDEGGFLMEPDQWDEDFATGLAPGLEIPRGLTREHWQVIRFIRETHEREGRCPLVFTTCRSNGLHLRDLQRLFPTGYLRGACKLAGITYKEACFAPGLVSIGDRFAASSTVEKGHAAASAPAEKTYTADARGFLVKPDDWDEHYALLKAQEMGVPEALTDKHWEIIHYLRESFKETGVVPTVYETCEANDLEIEDLEKLFPHGYHRGAVKIAGLRVR